LWTVAGSPPVDVTPHLLIQLEDELERARLREAFWISVVVHMAVVILLFLSPKLFPMMVKGVVLTTPSDLLRNQQLTYLDLPPDLQKAPKAVPEPKALSDKNRIAESRNPTLDRKTLEELKRAGSPGMQAPPSQSAQMTPPMQVAPPQQGQSQGQQMAQLQPPQSQSDSRLTTPQGVGKFPTTLPGMMSPGSAIEQAARAAAARRGSGSYGTGGDYGIGPGGSTAKVQGNLEVLTDTEGVDFGPYLSRVLQAVRLNWYNLIPEEARPPLLKRGKVAIEFVILKDGKVAGLRLIGPSGDISLDRAAWGGITASVPFSPLPNEFHGPYLGLRFHFYYNPAKGELD